jgi:hypothetical protein
MYKISKTNHLCANNKPRDVLLKSKPEETLLKDVPKKRKGKRVLHHLQSAAQNSGVESAQHPVA